MLLDLYSSSTGRLPDEGLISFLLDFALEDDIEARYLKQVDAEIAICAEGYIKPVVVVGWIDFKGIAKSHRDRFLARAVSSALKE